MSALNGCLVIGDGRLAKHLSFYLAARHIPVAGWNRKTNSREDLATKMARAEIVFLAISDDSIESFARDIPNFRGQFLVHFSGANEFPGLTGIHPLMAFTTELYAANFYEKIPLVSVRPKPRDFPFPNPWIQIPVEEKPFYHALCVLAGNFSVILWQNYFLEMQKLGLSFDQSSLFFEQTFENLKKHPDAAFVGPLARGDESTIQKNLQALRGDPFFAIYESFRQQFPQTQKKFKAEMTT